MCQGQVLHIHRRTVHAVGKGSAISKNPVLVNDVGNDCQGVLVPPKPDVNHPTNLNEVPEI